MKAKGLLCAKYRRDAKRLETARSATYSRY